MMTWYNWLAAQLSVAPDKRKQEYNWLVMTFLIKKVCNVWRVHAFQMFS